MGSPPPDLEKPRLNRLKRLFRAGFRRFSHRAFLGKY
jgi:hypothetical protein